MDNLTNKILWLIPARSGSKGVPDKNIKLLNNIPLLAYRILSAISISGRENVWLSTDSLKYSEIGAAYGVSVPFIRPGYLATDESSSMDVVAHAMEFAENNDFKYDYIGLLEPTSPFVYPHILVEALSLLEMTSAAQAIVAVKEVEINSFFTQEDAPYLKELALKLNSRVNLGRQNFNKQITPSGGFYISKWEAFKQNKTFYTEYTLAHKIPVECGLEIDEPMDWQWAEFLLKQGILVEDKIIK